MRVVIFKGFAPNVITIIQIYIVTLQKVTASTLFVDNVREKKTTYASRMVVEDVKWFLKGISQRAAEDCIL